MATIRLGLYEIKKYDLPKVCMCCGARARHVKTKTFQWFPPWAFLLLGVIGMLIFSKRATIDIPLCEKHKWHWGIRIALALLGVIIMLSLGILVGVIASNNEDLAPFLAIPLGAIFLAWLGTMIYLSTTAIGTTEITDKSITLRGVCEEFIDALEEARCGEGARSRRRARDDEDEDDRPRKQRRSADDEDDPHVYDPDLRRRKHRELD